MTAWDRQVARARLKEKMRKMNIKRKAMEIVLSDGETKVMVHAPTMSQFAEYIESFAVIQQIGTAFKELEKQSSGSTISLGAVKLSPEMMEAFYPLIASLSNISVDEYKALPVQDGMAIMLAYVQLLAPESMANPTQAGEMQPPREMAAPQT